ncbi:TPA: hypothetical protein L9M57_000043 [Klebsiella quasipneumoniae subsp. similipneumoniae]|nr:hypothetical protein [Klebsiella quasipneumoniae subsp. similipneumoniae]HDH1396932.1 hypothetical protein [Klebsiella quasipneumoniae subsp. similipneumoniae]
MAANIVSPAQNGRFYYGCAGAAGAAGLLAGLAIVFWFPALASWWPSDLVRVYHAMPYVMRFGVTSVADIPLVAYATLTLSGFVLAFCHPGHSKLPIVAWAVHNQPSPREMVDWILRSWALQLGFLVIIFWRFAFMSKLSSDRLMQIAGICNDVCYLATLVLAAILLRDGWRGVKGVAAPAGNIRIPLIVALSFYLPFQLVWILLSAQQYELPLWGWLLLVPAMVGVLLARLATVGIALCFRCWLGPQGCLRWRGPLALFSGLTVLCIGGNAVIRQILRMLS